MAVKISDHQAKLLEKAGFSDDEVQTTIDGYRKQGLSDDQIQSKMNQKYPDINPIADIAYSALAGLTEIPNAFEKLTHPLTKPLDRVIDNSVSTILGKNPLSDEKMEQLFNEAHNDYKPQTTAGGISKFIGGLAPYLLAPELKGGQIVNGIAQGSVMGGTNAANANQNPLVGAGEGAVVGAVAPKAVGLAGDAYNSIKNGMGQFLTNIPPEIYDKITQPGSKEWQLIKDTYNQAKNSPELTALQQHGNDLYSGFRNDIESTQKNLGKAVGSAKENLFNAFDNAKQVAFNNLKTNGIKQATKNVYKATGNAYDNFNNTISDSEATIANLKNRYLQTEKQLANNPNNKSLSQDLEDTKRQLASELWHNVDQRQQMQGNLNGIVDDQNNKLLKEKMSLIKQYNLYPDLSDTISQLNAITKDRQYTDFPFASKVRSVLQELTEGVSPQRGQELMDRLDSKGMIDYVKEHPEFGYDAGKLQDAAKSGRSAINSGLKNLSDKYTGGEYGKAKDAFSSYLTNEQNDALQRILQPNKQNETDTGLEALLKITNPYGQGFAKDAVKAVSSNPNQLVNDINTQNTAREGLDAINEQGHFKMAHDPLYMMIKNLSAPIRDIAYKPDSQIPAIDLVQKANQYIKNPIAGALPNLNMDAIPNYAGNKAIAPPLQAVISTSDPEWQAMHQNLQLTPEGYSLTPEQEAYRQALLNVKQQQK